MNPDSQLKSSDNNHGCVPSNHVNIPRDPSTSSVGSSRSSRYSQDSGVGLDIEDPVTNSGIMPQSPDKKIPLFPIQENNDILKEDGETLR